MPRNFDVFPYDVPNTVALSRVTVGPARGTAAEKRERGEVKDQLALGRSSSGLGVLHTGAAIYREGR
jgi:hypothetical protein